MLERTTIRDIAVGINDMGSISVRPETGRAPNFFTSVKPLEVNAGLPM
jgi:hypothetical protein